MPATTLPASYEIRAATTGDIDCLFRVRASTSENAIAPGRLAELGITPAVLHETMLAGTSVTWVCQTEGQVVAFCSAQPSTGEVTVLAVMKGHERRGIGRELLAAAVDVLRASGCRRIWLAAGLDSRLRSHGFYRANGWRPTGRLVGHGDEELELDESLN